MKIPTLGSPEIWPILAPRLARYNKPKLGRAINAAPFPERRKTNKFRETHANTNTPSSRQP